MAGQEWALHDDITVFIWLGHGTVLGRWLGEVWGLVFGLLCGYLLSVLTEYGALRNHIVSWTMWCLDLCTLPCVSQWIQYIHISALQCI